MVRVAVLVFASSLVVLCGLRYRMVEWAEVGLLIARASLTPCAADSGYSNAVDIFNVTSGAWSTAALSVARYDLAATSLPNHGVAIFAGGQSTCCHDDFLLFACCVLLCCFCWGIVWLSGRRFALLICACKSHALCSGQRQLLQRCGHFQRGIRSLEHCSSQRSSRKSCSHIAAESRSRDLRWWLEYVLPC